MVNSKIEKYAVYSKGFKGLPDGWHNIRACNFLVGENSTGKSSFLQLVQLIDTREHMVFFDLCGAVKGIDTSFDVCSRINKSNETTIGFLIKEKIADKNKNKAGFFGRMSTYKKVGDEMQLSRITMLAGNRILRLKRGVKRISYRFGEFKYNEKLSHSDNCDKFELIHFKQGDRFQNYEEVEWGDAPEQHDWMRTLNSAIHGTDVREDRKLLTSYSPLNSLHHGPIRAKTRRLYHGTATEFSSTGEHVPYLLRNAINMGSKTNEAIENFGRISGLFDSISVTSVKTSINDKPFALEINKNGSVFYTDELGYGLGQVLPIVSDIAMTHGMHTFLIQQPELHLHPRAQAALGDLFQSAMEDGGVFIIETHSDFLIDRFRIKNKNAKKHSRSQIKYFEKNEDGKNASYEIELNSDGTTSDVPDGYRDFFIRENIEKFENL